MTKRYSGKSFKDSSVNKKPKFTMKEKRRLKKEKAKKTKQRLILFKILIFIKFFKVFKKKF